MGKQLVTYTFKGTAPPGAAAAGGLLSTRAAFYGKTAGQVQHDTSSGLLKVASQVSGYTLTVPDGSGPNHHAAIKDPLTGLLCWVEVDDNTAALHLVFRPALTTLFKLRQHTAHNQQPPRDAPQTGQDGVCGDACAEAAAGTQQVLLFEARH